MYLLRLTNPHERPGTNEDTALSRLDSLWSRFWKCCLEIFFVIVIVVRALQASSRLEILVEEGLHVFEAATTGFGVEKPCDQDSVSELCVWKSRDLHMMIAETKFVLMKTKCVFEPIVLMPMGHVCDEMMAPMDDPEAAMLRPRARKLVGKIWWKVSDGCC